MQAPSNSTNGKPTVFLSHSSSNRRELLALKRLLDARSGGMIDFFLSSDDDSITHGTIWPVEVRAALDRMQLMLIFVSPEALKSGWTYFEAGYGLHKLGVAKIYCLPGTDKAALPSPFDLLQNRNLHCSRDVGFLVQQLNEAFKARMDFEVSQDDFDKIFRRPSLGQVESGPRFEELVERIDIIALGPPGSYDIFAQVCKKLGLPVSKQEPVFESRDLCSTGVRFSESHVHEEELLNEIKVTDEMRIAGSAKIINSGEDDWRIPNRHDRYRFTEVRSIHEIDGYNERIHAKNEAIRAENARHQTEPRDCSFRLVPLNMSVSGKIVDEWLSSAAGSKIVRVKVKYLADTLREERPEAVSAKIYGSRLSLLSDGSLLWLDAVVVSLDKRKFASDEITMTLSPSEGIVLGFGQIRLTELVATLFQLGIYSRAQPARKKR